MKIAVIGLGYVGLANALALAQKNEVLAYDIDSEKIAALKSGKSPIKETAIEAFLQKDLSIIFTSDYSQAIANSRYIIIATPTDYDAEKNYFDTSSVESTIEKAVGINRDAVFVIKSTIPVGYVDELRKKYGAAKIVFSPEFLREGRALEDVLEPTRVIVGDKSQLGEDIASLFKAVAPGADTPVLLTGPTEAEAIKLFANTYLANRVAFFNELDTYSAQKNLDSADIITGVCLDPRIGNHYNNPSFGYGGYCLPKDTKQLLANYADIPNDLMMAVIESNKTRKEFIAQQIINRKPRTVGIYRLVMKASSDNFRESSVLDVLNILKEANIQVVIYEPVLNEAAYDGHEIQNDLVSFKNGCDLIVANRVDDNLSDVIGKVYTRDIFHAG